MAATRVFDWLGYPLPWADVGSNYITIDLNASDVKYAMVFQAEDAVAITHCGFRYSLRTGTPPVYKISIQSVSASDGKPTGTILGGGTPASATFTPPASTAWDGTWQWVALDNSYTPAVGDLFAVVIEYSSGTINGSNFGRFTNRGLATDNSIFARPYGVIGGSGSWTVQARPYIMGYKTASRAYGHPHTSFVSTSYSSNSTPDAYGLVFTIPAADSGWSSFVLKGIRWLGHLSDSASCSISIRVRDLSGGGAGTLVVTETLDTDQMGGTSTSWQDYIFIAPPTLNTGTKYAVMLEAVNTGMNLSLTKITTPGATEAAAFIGGANYYSGTSTDSGTITEDTSSRPCMALMVEAITANAGGGTTMFIPVE